MMRTSKPRGSTNTPATCTPEKQHPQSFPRERERENKRLNKTDLPESTRVAQRTLTRTNIKRRLDVTQRRCSSSAHLSQLGRRSWFKVRRQTIVLTTSTQLQSQEEAFTFTECIEFKKEKNKIKKKTSSFLPEPI